MRRWRAVLVPIIVGLLAAGGGLAQDKGKEKDKDKDKDRKDAAEIEVWSIRATTKNKDISPELKELAEVLKKQFKFTGFKLEKKASGKPETGKSFDSASIGTYKVSVTLSERKDKNITLKVLVKQVEKDKDGKEKEKNVLDTTVKVEAGKSVPFGGLALEGGDSLILAIRAR